MMREEKLYSAMYILGTALAIAFTMLIAEVYYIKVADIAPEVNRSKTYYLNGFYRGEHQVDECIYSDTFRDLLQTMKTPESIMATADWQLWDHAYMKLADNVHDRVVRVKLTEPGFFRFFQFHFIPHLYYYIPSNLSRDCRNFFVFFVNFQYNEVVFSAKF